MDLIPRLPRRQLLGQWRECCLIAKSIHEKGIPNHILVNRIMEYPLTHFWNYGFNIYLQMLMRGYKCDWDKFDQWFGTEYPYFDRFAPLPSELFSGWHNERYLHQCLANLQEKHDCGAIPDDEWEKIADKYPEWR